MKLATVRSGASTTAVRIDDETAVDLGVPDVGAVLRRDAWMAWAETAAGPEVSAEQLDYAPLIPSPDKILCVGLNYKGHILETGADTPLHPTLFSKTRGSLIGATDEIVLPPESQKVDYEAELAVIIGHRARRVSVGEAGDVIAGYATFNDVSMRDWQRRTRQWFQGKAWERSTPFGPWLVTRDESPGPARRITCEVNGEVVQDADTSDLLFDPMMLVAYISTVVTLLPGDVIATGTPSGVGGSRRPERYLQHGDVVVTRIAGVGGCRNVCRDEFGVRTEPPESRQVEA